MNYKNLIKLSLLSLILMPNLKAMDDIYTNTHPTTPGSKRLAIFTQLSKGQEIEDTKSPTTSPAHMEVASPQPTTSVSEHDKLVAKLKRWAKLAEKGQLTSFHSRKAYLALQLFADPKWLKKRNISPTEHLIILTGATRLKLNLKEKHNPEIESWQVEKLELAENTIRQLYIESVSPKNR